MLSVRRTRMSVSVLVLLSLLLTGCGGDGGKDDSSAKGAPKAPKVVASTTWAGAFAKAAGAASVAVVAPATTIDPAGYDPRPEELTAVADADFVVYAESDKFAAELQAAVSDKNKLVKVDLKNSAQVIKAEVTRLGGLFGTAAAAARWLASFAEEYEGHVQHVGSMAPIPPWRAVTDVDVASWAEFARVPVVGSYGATALTPAELARLTSKKPRLVLANAHQPAGTPSIPGAKRIDLFSYPNADLELGPVFNTNAELIGRAFTG